LHGQWKIYQMKITSQQLRAARALLDWNSADLARASGVSEPTIWRIEAVRGELGGRPDTVGKLVGAVEAAGIEFTNGDQPGVRLRKPAVPSEPDSLPKPVSRTAPPKPPKKTRPRRP
jgi:transcriptional regulator with XRE-family HTH domain